MRDFNNMIMQIGVAEDYLWYFSPVRMRSAR